MKGHIRLQKEGERQFRIVYLDPNSDYEEGADNSGSITSAFHPKQTLAESRH